MNFTAARDEQGTGPLLSPGQVAIGQHSREEDESYAYAGDDDYRVDGHDRSPLVLPAQWSEWAAAALIWINGRCACLPATLLQTAAHGIQKHGAV